MYKNNWESIRKRIMECLVILLVLGLMTTVSGKADDEVDIDALQQSITEKEGQISDLETEKQSIAAGRANVQNIINNLQASKNELSTYVTELDSQVTEIQTNIDNYNALIEAKEAEIAETQTELDQARQVAEEQYAAMKERIRFMYEKGDGMYLDLLLSADSFSDMLNKANYIEALSAYDRKKLEEYRAVIQYTELCESQLEEEQSVLQEAKEALESDQAAINELIEQKTAEMAAYDADIDANEDMMEAYDDELAAQNSVIEALEAQLAADKSALAEANQRHYSGGQFAWPAPSYTRISDEYGWRMHPTLHVEKFHNGIDMAAPGGSPILAAYDGEVAAAGYSSSMGNYIMINHGDGLYTIYMHASALYVSVGQTVSRGEQIAAVGSTGRSTGNHLHFGVRLNGEYVNPYNYL